LIVDDESRIRLALRACLEAEGYDVTEAADGEEGIRAAGDCNPDVMIVDLAMPRKNGYEMIEELRAQHLDDMPKVVVLTAYHSALSPSASTRIGPAALLEKPLLPDLLRQTVRSLLEHEKADLRAGSA
jgi:DNA-binding response OmpR family regulator